MWYLDLNAIHAEPDKSMKTVPLTGDEFSHLRMSRHFRNWESYLLSFFFKSTWVQEYTYTTTLM